MKKHNSKIEIRIANKDDAGFIALLGRVTFTETFGHLFRNRQDLIDYYDSTFSVDKIEKSISKPNNVYWIAFVDRLAVGFAKLKLDSQSEFIAEEKICQLQKIYVLKDFLSKKSDLNYKISFLKKPLRKTIGQYGFQYSIVMNEQLSSILKTDLRKLAITTFKSEWRSLNSLQCQNSWHKTR